jgi:8-hydroxy-5-deazaflavin:NADPH oxidoreductase
MNIGILGTGMVGEAIAGKLVQLGHHVCMGSRKKGHAKATAWASAAGAAASEGSFADAVAFGEIVVLCLKGDVVLDVLRSIGSAAFAGRVVVDVSNPLDFSHGLPPSLLICNTNSLGEEVQKHLPGAHVVKTLNIVNCEVMVDPAKAGDVVTMLICGNDAAAKAKVAELLRTVGWQDILDLGGMSAARGMEMMLPVWLSLWSALGSPHFGFRIVRP